MKNYRNWIIFDRYSSKDYGLYVDGRETFNAAERDFEKISIPGKSGDLTIDNGRYKNIDLRYRALVPSGFEKNVEAYRNLLLSRVGYKRLEDTFHPEEYRMGRFSGIFTGETKKDFNIGSFTILFDCMPQRFLKLGDEIITLTSSGQIINQNITVAKPIVRVYGTGTVTINGLPIQITAADVYTDINCETENAYKNTSATNCNGNIVLQDGKFWTLVHGYNTITLGSGISKVEITPKWWIL